jgi:hypothetical protein
MSTRPDLDRSITEWLVAEVPDRAPERLLEASRERVRITRQRRAWWPAWRVPPMNNTVRIIAASAAVVVLGLIGYQLLFDSNVGGPPPAPSETPESSPSSTPEPTPSEPIVLVPEMGGLFAGQYLITDVAPFTITITIPSGWESLGVPAQVWGPGADRPTVGYFTLEGIFTDPCDPTQGFRTVGPTVDELVQALTDDPSLNVEQTSTVTASGFEGTQIAVTGAAVDCGAVEPVWMRTQPGSVDRPRPDAAEPAQLTILDVAGDRLVIIATGTTGAESAAVASIVDSTVIEAP